MLARRRTGTRRRRPRAGGIAAALAMAALAAACGSVRPYLRPLPGAPADTLDVDASQLITMLGGILIGEGMRLRTITPEEGYLETEWYDLERHRPVSGRTRSPHNVVRFRFFADPIADEESVLVSEGVYRLTLDPSVPEREREVLVAGDHPGLEILERVRSTVRMLQGRGGG